MGKTSTPKNGSAKIRFVMLEADIVDGDLDQITQAIQNAFRPNTVVQYKVASPERAPLAAIEANDDISTEFEEIANPDSSPLARRASPSGRTARPRKGKTPTVLELDLKTEPAWQDFAKEYELQSDFDRYLTVALWFKEARGIASITADHAYTCYRAAGWPTGISDFAKPLRNLRDRQFMNTGPNGGEYAINHLGTDRVLKLRKASD